MAKVIHCPDAPDRAMSLDCITPWLSALAHGVSASLYLRRQFQDDRAQAACPCLYSSAFLWRPVIDTPWQGCQPTSKCPGARVQAASPYLPVPTRGDFTCLARPWHYIQNIYVFSPCLPVPAAACTTRACAWLYCPDWSHFLAILFISLERIHNSW